MQAKSAQFFVALFFLLMMLTGCTGSTATQESAADADAPTTSNNKKQTGTTLPAKLQLAPDASTCFPNKCILYGDQLFVDPDLKYCLGYPDEFHQEDIRKFQPMTEGATLKVLLQNSPVVGQEPNQQFVVQMLLETMSVADDQTLEGYLQTWENDNQASFGQYRKLEINMSHSLGYAYIDLNNSRDVYVKKGKVVYHFVLRSSHLTPDSVESMDALYTSILDTFSFFLGTDDKGKCK
jgi:hypothetical protein